MADAIRRKAVEIVLAEERERGWTPNELRATSQEFLHGCDVLSTPPDGGKPHPVEVKGWGDPIFVNGRFTWPADLLPSQCRAANANPNFRLEIVGNLRAFIADPRTGFQRLTLRADDIVGKAEPSQYIVPLTGLEDRVSDRQDDPSVRLAAESTTDPL